MRQSILDRLDAGLSGLNPSDPDYATVVVQRVLEAGRATNASDLHFTPTGDGLQLKFRLDGVLRRVAIFPCELAPNIVTRLKVHAGLLTYQTDRPQEGRIQVADDTEVRVSTFPTLHGERAVVRLFGQTGKTTFQRLDDLGLHDDIRTALGQLLVETSGAVIVSGPAGSGKTTTAYACLRELIQQTDGGRSFVSLEDPIEVAVDGVAQTQVQPSAGLDLATGLRFLMRQDPEVIMVGEIRDRDTAEAAMQASLTGHLLLSTFHAGSAAETLSRLLDMGLEPYVLRSGLLSILSQRLARSLCECAIESDDPMQRLGLPVDRFKVPVGCEACGDSGYRGRFLIAEMLSLKSVASTSRDAGNNSLARAILDRADSEAIEQLAIDAGMVGRWQRACRVVEDGVTSPAEIRRVLGFVGGETIAEEEP